jgi:cytochrome c553
MRRPRQGFFLVLAMAIMAGMVAALSDDDMRNVAAWYAAQKAKQAVQLEAGVLYDA